MTILIVDSYKGRKVNLGSMVFTYRNLSKDCISISLNGLVHGYSKAVYLSDVSFIVRAVGNRNVRIHKQKNVHAFVKGRLDSSVNEIDDIDEAYRRLEMAGYKRVYYNPYKVSSFVLYESQEAIYEAGEAVVIMDRVYVKEYNKSS